MDLEDGLRDLVEWRDLPLDEERDGCCDVRYGDEEPFLDVYLCEEEEDKEEFLDLDRVADLERSIKYVSLWQLYSVLMWFTQLTQ